MRKPDMKKLFQNRHSFRETMHMTWLLFREQMHYIRKSPAASLVVLALILLPPLYAWLNIAASWDPYGNTKSLIIAVSNEDAGATVENVEVNMGDSIVDALKQDDNFGWTFMDKDQAMKKINTGEIYGAIVIPEDFSKDLTNFVDGKPRKANIEFYSNEKLNSISAKITDMGMKMVTNTVNQTFVETLTHATLNALKVLDDKYGEYRPTLLKMFDTMDVAAANMDLFITNMNDFENLINQADDLTKSAEGTLPLASQSLQEAADMTLGAQDTLQQAKNTVSDIDRLINQSIASMNVLGDTIVADSQRLKDMTNDDIDGAKGALQNVIDDVDILSDHVHNVSNTLARFNKMIPEHLDEIDQFVDELDAVEAQLQSTANELRGLRSDLNDANADVVEIANRTAELTRTLNNTINQTWNDYNQNVHPGLDNMTDQMITTLDDTYSLLNSTSDLIPQVDGVLATIRNMKPAGTETIDHFRDTLRESQDLVQQATDDMRDLTDEDKYQKVLNFIRQDIDDEASFLADPVELDNHRIYPVPNFGSGMAPFYTVLANWVGALLTLAMVSPINIKGLQAYPKTWTAPMYLSRLWLFQMIGLLQGIVIPMGDLFILGVHCVHPVLFVLLSVFVSQVFAIFLFSLLFTFGDVGKALAIVILVLQINGTGGTYPIEIAPLFFKIVNPLLPFTYAIAAMREVCAGIYWPNLIYNASMLLLVPVASFLLVLTVGPLVRQWIKKFEHSMRNGGLS
jgi:putative membrane protein